MTAEAVQAEGWYISRDGEMEGPLPSAEMRAAIGRGAVKPEHLVWRDGMPLWVEAREIPNFAELRKAHLDSALADGREKSRDRVRAQKPPANADRAANAARRNEARSEAVTRSPTERPTPAAQPRKIPWDLPKTAGGQIDLEKIATQTLGKIGRIPPGAIVFFVLGLIFTPLLPIFWFIAWRIWAKGQQ